MEECQAIEVRQLRRGGPVARPGRARDVGRAGHGVGRRVGLQYTVGCLAGRPIRLPVRVAWTPCHFGGRRPWFLCLGRGCGRRVAKLCLPLRGGASYYLCRHCHDLTYRSRQTWNKRLAALRRRRKAEVDLRQVLRERPLTIDELRAALRGLAGRQARPQEVTRVPRPVDVVELPRADGQVPRVRRIPRRGRRSLDIRV